MTRSRIGAVVPTLLLVLLSSCRDGPTDPAATRLTLVILSGAAPFEEETLAPGAKLDLDAKLRNATGDEVSGGTIQWKSDNEAVATVGADGLVTAGSQTGSARIIATNGTQADTGLVNVAQPVTGAVACAAGNLGIFLPVGGSLSLTGPEATELCIRGDTLRAEFALVSFNASVAANSRMTVHHLASSVTGVFGPPVPSVAPSDRVLAGPALRRDQEFHERLLARSRDESRLRLPGGLQPTAALQVAAPKVGDLLPLNVQSDPNKDACSGTDIRTGRVVAITERAVVVADTANPRNGFTDQDYRAIGVAFDTLVWKVNTQNFGTPSDIDKNSRVLLFYTRAVNELTPLRSSDSYVGGFFYNRDLFPKTGQKPCAGSNYAEMFYMLVPDPQGTVNDNPRSVDFVRNSTLGVLAHEFQHLINDSRRLYESKAPVWEETWLNEGLSHIAEELVFYTASGLAPRQNIGPAELVGRVRDAYNQFASDNMGRLVRFLREPESSSLMGSADLLPTRGAIWAFLRYAADREPGSDAAMWSRLVNSRTRGLDNLAEVLAVNPRDWMRDWAVSVYTDDAGLPVDSRYQQPSWNFRTIIPATTVSNGQYPLRTRSLAGSSGVTVNLAGGGALYGRFAILAGQRGAVRTTVGGLPPNSRLRVTLVRTR